MGKTDDIIIIDNQTGMDFDELPSRHCAFVCSHNTTIPTICHSSCIDKLEELCKKGYLYFFVEWGSLYGNFALNALMNLKELNTYSLKIIAVHVIGRRKGTNPDIKELINIFRCDAIVYAYTQTDLIRALVSQCSAVVTEQNILYPLI